MSRDSIYYENYDAVLHQIRQSASPVDEDLQMEDAFESSSAAHGGWAGRKAIIIDTNILISHLPLLDEAANLLASAIKGGKAQGFLYGFVIPHQVRLELDSLKQRKVQLAACHRATVWMTGQLQSSTKVVYFQGRNERQREVKEFFTNDTVDHQLQNQLVKGDELIFDCVEYFHERTGGLTVLMTNDRNFRNEGLGYGIKVVSTLDGSGLTTFDAYEVLSEGFNLQLDRPRSLHKKRSSERGGRLTDSIHAPPPPADRSANYRNLDRAQSSLATLPDRRAPSEAASSRPPLRLNGATAVSRRGYTFTHSIHAPPADCPNVPVFVSSTSAPDTPASDNPPLRTLGTHGSLAAHDEPASHHARGRNPPISDVRVPAENTLKRLALNTPEVEHEDVELWRRPTSHYAARHDIGAVITAFLQDRLREVLWKSCLPTNGDEDTLERECAVLFNEAGDIDGMLVDNESPSSKQGAHCIALLDHFWDRGIRDFFRRPLNARYGDPGKRIIDHELRAMRARLKNIHKSLLDVDFVVWPLLRWLALAEEVGAILQSCGLLTRHEEELAAAVVDDWTDALQRIFAAEV